MKVIELRNYSAETDFLQEQKQMRALARKLQTGRQPAGARSFKLRGRGHGEPGRKAAGGSETSRKAGGGGGGARKLQRHVLDRKRKREQQERKRLRYCYQG